MCRKLVFLAFVVLVLSLVGKAPAAEIEWEGPGTDWCSGVNWIGEVEPNESDVALFVTPSPIVIQGPGCDVNVGWMHGPAYNYDGSITQVMDIIDAEVIVQNDWYMMNDHGSSGPTSTINISGSSLVKILGGGVCMRGQDRATTNLNILSTGSGDPNFIANGVVAGADGETGVFDFVMTGGYFQANGLSFGDDGSGTCTITGGTMILGGNGLLLKARSCDGDCGPQYVQFTLDGGAYVETTGGFGCPTSSNGTGEVYLNNGTLICNSFDSDGFNWHLDIDAGVLWKIKGDRISQIQGFITSGLITGKNGTEDPLVIFDGEYTRVGFDLFQGPATKPNPSSPTSGICPENGITLTWTAGEKADRHEVYFGTNWNDVNDATTAVDPCGVYQGSQNLGNESYPTGWLEYGKTYYWRIDEVNDTDPCTWTGGVWSFSTPSGRATNPSPPNGRRGIRPGPVLLRWTLPCYLTAQTLYYGTDPCSATWTSVALGANDDEYQLPSPSSPSEHYYWRVDTTAGALGVITGDTWNFTTGIGGRLLHLKFENNLSDSSGNDYHFTNDTSGGGHTIAYTYDATAPKPAIYGNSADFVPDTRLYRNDIGENDLLRLNGSEYTVEMWVYPRNLTTILPNENDTTYLISKHSDVGDRDWGFRIYNNNGDSYEFRWDAYSPDNDSTEALEDEWQHIAIVYYEGDEDLSGWYVNGEKGDNGGGRIQPDNNSPVWIGVEQEAGGSFGLHFDGLIDEIRIHDIAVGPCGLLHISRDPEYPLCPYPGNGVQDIDPCGVILTWLPGESATSHLVYFSSEEADVQNLDGSAYLDEYTYAMSDIQVLDYGTTYYWRVVEQPGDQEGDVWKFTTEFIVDDETLRLHYKLDETSGDTAYDSSGYGNHGDVDDDDGWDPEGGQFGGSFGFNDDNRIDAPGEATSSISPSVSISCWLKDSFKLGGDNFVFGIGNGLYEIRAAVPMADGRTIEWRAGNDSNDVLLWDMFRDKADPRTLEDWHHWVFVKDETAGEIKIYFDGELADANDVVDTTLIRLRESELSIGAASGNPDDLKGSVDDFRLYDIALDAAKVTSLFRGGELELAWSPDPRNGATDVDPDVVLRWRPGDFAVEHDVYIGNTKSDVVDANTSTVGIYIGSFPNSPDNNYPLPASLPLGSIRYWRIDEVNGPNTWKGPVWRFTVADFIILDDFEQYDTDQKQIQYTWYDQYSQEMGQATGAWLELAQAPRKPVYRGEQAMSYTYDTDDPWAAPGYYYAEAWLPLEEIGGFQDWTSVDVRLLTLFFYGQAGNDATEDEQMYVAVDDTFGTYAEMRYGDNEGESLSDIQVEEWQRWDIPFIYFSDGNFAAVPEDVDFSSVANVYIGFGNRRSPVAAGKGIVFFDDLLLSKPICKPEYGPVGDLDDDCIIGIGDVGAMGEQWLRGDVDVSPVTAPSDANRVARWQLDGNANDSWPNAYHGTAEGAYEWTAGKDGQAIDLSGGWVVVDDNGVTPKLRPKHYVSVMAWIYLDGEAGGSDRIVIKGRNDNETFGLEVSSDDGLAFIMRDANNPGSVLSVTSGGDAISENEWIHVAGTYDNNEQTCYVNGAEEGSATRGSIELIADANDGLGIGGRYPASDTSGRFEGKIDDVRVYDRAVSRAEIAWLASGGDGVVELTSEANLFIDDPAAEVINFRDFAKLLESWGVEQLWPPEP
ncbi:MAG TPA: LamG domain-containing protein [Sedimentisphaerales bacterium]|nr:LamG domain-containing protein [Sedimentisphaerales bacterium]